jgi:hypothetical protein
MSVLGDYYRAQIQDLAAKQTGAAQERALQQSAQGSIDNLRNAQADAARSGARQNDAQTGQLGADSAAKRGLLGAQAGQIGAQTGQSFGQSQADLGLTQSKTRGLDIANQFAPLQLTSDLDTAAVNRQATKSTYSPTGNVDTAPLSSAGGSVGAAPGTGLGAFPNRSNVDYTQGDATGGMILSKKDAVQGKAKKPGPTDTVPAMLTPGEAVLNKGAVDHFGPDLVQHMNNMGLMKMGAHADAAQAAGLPDPYGAPPAAQGGKKGDKGADAPAKDAAPAGGRRKGKSGKRQGFASGTPQVQPAGTVTPTSAAMLALMAGAGGAPVATASPVVPLMPATAPGQAMIRHLFGG